MRQQEVREFQRKILTWFAKNRRDLPWREVPDGTSLHERAYRILVSEVMLQQTQVARVIPKYEAWLVRFPTIRSLIKARTSEVLALWSGLGYNRRALYLKKAAEIIVRDYNGEIPSDEKALRQLPGIGQYTARAVLCFVYNKQVAMVDTNIRKVILLDVIPNLFRDPGSNEMLKRVQHDNAMIQKIADQLLPKGKAYEWNHALMDYAASVLSREKIPIKKQSPFLGSNRYYRGRIVKLLLEQPTLSVRELERYLGSNGEHLHQIIEGLARDGLVRMDRTTVSLV